jgi:hypothetical protein
MSATVGMRGTAGMPETESATAGMLATLGIHQEQVRKRH